TPIFNPATRGSRSPALAMRAPRKPRSGRGRFRSSPGHGPESTSSPSAVSATVRVSTPWVASAAPSTPEGPLEILPRETFRPTSPHAPAGIRIDPPPSDPCAIGTIPAATAAPAPPEEPPGDRVGSHGFTGGGAISVSVYGGRPSSGVAVLPTMIAPASANRVTTP